ncbi:MAG: LysM peptidoglycan-binding domain-containing protein [Pseudomonadota bacterium]
MLPLRRRSRRASARALTRAVALTLLLVGGHAASDSGSPGALTDPAGPDTLVAPQIHPQVTIRREPWRAPTQPLWPQIRRALTLDHQLDNKRVAQEIRWLRTHPDYVTRMGPRFKRYLPHIFAQVQARGLPAELIFVPVIESALDPFAFSPGGAVGLWQFMPATGKRFGLKTDWWVDERRDPVLATRAALDYLEALYRQFDDWYLAIGAYNAGEGRMRSAIRRAKSRDFFKLRLPKETRGYLPRLLAYAEVFGDPERYGVEVDALPARDALRVIDTGGQFDVALAARALQISVETLYEWNPALNQWATHPAGPHQLLIGSAPADAQQLISAIPADKRLAWQRYRIKGGDTLSGLVARFGVDLETLRKANKLSSNSIVAGKTLLIPRQQLEGDYPLPAARRGAGRRLYKVAAGDSLWALSRKFKVGLTTLMRLNHIGPKDTLRVGQEIIVPNRNQGIVRKINYKVRRGDNLSLIAKRFKVSTGQIVSWNQIERSAYLQPGQRLALYVDVTAAN